MNELANASVHIGSSDLVAPLPGMEKPAEAQPSPAYGYGPPPATEGTPHFFLKERRKENGEVRMVEMVSITTAGDTRAVPVFKVNDVTRQKYRWYYDLWKQGLQATPRGTPLESWPILTSDQVRSLKANNVFTVEHLAAMADANENRMPMIRTLKNQAKEWLAEKGKIQEKDAARAENDQLRGAISMLEQQIAELRANQVKGAAEPNHAIDAGRMNSDLEGMTAALSEATQSDDRKAEGPSDPDEFGATVPLESGEGLKPPYDQYGWGDLRAEYTRRFGKGPAPKMNTEAVVKALSDNDAA